MVVMARIGCIVVLSFQRLDLGELRVGLRKIVGCDRSREKQYSGTEKEDCSLISPGSIPRVGSYDYDQRIWILSGVDATLTDATRDVLYAIPVAELETMRRIECKDHCGLTKTG
jgi:hypothetical protein